MARIGEPFFTTKAPGRGMGLGLFLARAVVEGVGGSLQIDSPADGGAGSEAAGSEANVGTEVRVRLPTDVAPASGQIVAPGAMRESSPGRIVSKPA